MKHAMAKFGPQLLLPEHKEQRPAVANDTGRTVRGPKVYTLKGNEASLSLCTIFLVLSSINRLVFIAHGWTLSVQTHIITLNITIIKSNFSILH